MSQEDEALQECVEAYLSACSLTTSRGSLSSRNPRKLACLRCPSGVHSRIPICATSFGFSQQHSFMASAVNAIPRRAFAGSGKLSNGHFVVPRPLNLL